ncbi:hypothetical protein LSTR_LSTR014810 [Laodelphax striatellus]|uniref:Cadherin domain-containing protein n=1 Tax=Laodelphax striatellus TaxID=195883 RepID=A0A482XBU4_LAOST|nr:hypothetical protein LSTR_LSTR014810 [Laodelphax striatellus]
MSRSKVLDTNDNAPAFAESAYSFDVAENAGRGWRVGRVEARDDDLGANGLLSYSVVSDWANDVFALNPNTGVFTLTARLDYEEVSVVQSLEICYLRKNTGYGKHSAAILPDFLIIYLRKSFYCLPLPLPPTV